MINLNAIISTLSKDEQQYFITYLQNKNKRVDTKNIKLFKLLAANLTDSRVIQQKLYSSSNKDAYHALRKRLYQSLIDFIASLHLEKSHPDNLQIIKYTMVARTFLEQEHYTNAYKLLDKAEKIAKAQDAYAYLNEIYNTQIQFAHHNPKVDLTEVIEKFKTNQKHYYLEQELNLVYAKLRDVLNKITYQGQVVDFETLLEEILNTHNISISQSLSFKTLYQLITIASISAFVTKDYLQIEDFLINNYQRIKSQKTHDQHRFYHIQVLYMIANALFRNKKLQQSLEYLDNMHLEMLKHNRKYYNRFKLKHHLLKGLNLNYNNQQDEAISLLEPYLNNRHPDLESLLDIHLSVIVFYFQKGNFKKAHSILSKFYHTDAWYIEKAGKEWAIKKHLIEILLHLELTHLELFESRLTSFKRQYTKYLKEVGQDRVLQFLKLVEAYYKAPENATSEAFFNRVETSFVWVDAKREDIFVMSFYAWLKVKWNKNHSSKSP